MKIIITGFSGFIGQNLTSYLEGHGFQIEKVSLRDSLWNKNISFTSVALIHLAGIAHDTSDSKKKEEYFKVNRDLTIEVFKGFLKSDIRDFIFFSSVKAAADKVDGILTEDVIPNPQTVYGQSKFEAEIYILNQKIPEGKRVFILRPTMVHGPGNKGNLNLLYKVVRKGIPWPLASFYNKRSFLSIDNLNYIVYELLADPHIQSGIYHLADDESLSTNELIHLMSENLSRKPRLWKISPSLIRKVAAIGDKIKLPLNTERLNKLTDSYIVSNSKIKKAINQNSLPLSASEGMKKTIISFD